MYDTPCNSGAWGSLGDGGLWGWIGLVLNLVVWGGLIAALVVLVVWAVRRARVAPVGGQPTAVEILQTQYARGEITREQYQQMLGDLS